MASFPLSSDLDSPLQIWLIAGRAAFYKQPEGKAGGFKNRKNSGKSAWGGTFFTQGLWE